MTEHSEPHKEIQPLKRTYRGYVALALFAALTLPFLTLGCGGKDENETSNSNTSSSTTQPGGAGGAGGGATQGAPVKPQAAPAPP